MHKKSLVIPLLFFTCFCAAQENKNNQEKNFGYNIEFGLKSLTWKDESGLHDSTDYDPTIFKSLGFSLNSGKHWSLNMFMDFSEDSDLFMKYGANLGFKEYGITYETGDLKADFVYNDDLDFQPNESGFNGDFKLTAVWRNFTYSSMGIGLAEWNMPLEASVNQSGPNPQVRFIDPDVGIKIFGFYGRTNELRDFAMSGDTGGKFNIESQMIFGFADISPSDKEVDRVAVITGSRPSTDSRTTLAAYLEVRPGYHLKIKEGMALAFVYQLNMYYTLDLELSSDAPDNEVYTEFFGFIHGPGIYFSANW